MFALLTKASPKAWIKPKMPARFYLGGYILCECEFFLFSFFFFLSILFGKKPFEAYPGSVHPSVPVANTPRGCKSQWLKVNGDGMRTEKGHTHTGRERQREGTKEGGGRREKGERERRLGCSPLLVIWYRRGLTIKTPPMATMGIVFTKTGGCGGGRRSHLGPQRVI